MDLASTTDLEDRTPPHGGAKYTLETVHTEMANGFLRVDGNVAALRSEVRLALSPIRRTWPERIATVVVAVALSVIAYATVVGPRAEAKPVPAASSR